MAFGQPEKNLIVPVFAGEYLSFEHLQSKGHKYGLLNCWTIEEYREKTVSVFLQTLFVRVWIVRKFTPPVDREVGKGV